MSRTNRLVPVVSCTQIVHNVGGNLAKSPAFGLFMSVAFCFFYLFVVFWVTPLLIFKFNIPKVTQTQPRSSFSFLYNIAFPNKVITYTF